MEKVIIRPLVTEKMSAEAERYNRYGFLVYPDANKLQIRKAIEKVYGVNVEKVRTINYQGKKSSRPSKTSMNIGRKSSYKKAIVTLASGETIDFYSAV